MNHMIKQMRNLLQHGRSRLMVLVVLTVVLVLIAFMGLLSRDDIDTEQSSSLSSVPYIESLPGSINPTEEYAKLQASENVAKAKKAHSEGTSAIPTIIRTEQFGAGDSIPGLKEGEGGLGFSSLARSIADGGSNKAWLQNLINSKCSDHDLKAALEQGASVDELLQACSCLQLKVFGLPVSKIKQACSCAQLKQAGVGAQQLKAEGFTARQLRRCGYSACELRAAGFTLKEMQAAGFSAGELRGAGFDPEQIKRASGLTDAASEQAVRAAKCEVDQLKQLRAQGVSAAAIRRLSGCDAQTLRAAGFTAQELKDAGFNAAELRAAGFGADELKAAGFGLDELKEAGFSVEDEASSLKIPKDCTVEQLKLAHQAGVSAAVIKRRLGCSATALRAAGYSAKALKDAGFTASELKNAGFSARDLRAAGYDLDDLKEAGFSAGELRDAGFDPEQIKRASGLTDAASEQAIRAAKCEVDQLKQLRAQGVSAAAIRRLSGCDAQTLRAAGFTAQELKDAGFNAAELRAAGFGADELKAAGFGLDELKEAGFPVEDEALSLKVPKDCTVEQLKLAHQAGVSAAVIKRRLGCSATALRAAGYSAKALRLAGFSADELKAAGFDAGALKDAGFTASELKNAGFSARDLRAAGYDLDDLKEAGFTAKDLKNAGFTAKALRDAGFSAAELKAAGFSPRSLKAAGFTAKELKAAGFIAKDLLAAGFPAKDLKDAGFSQDELRTAGVDAATLAQLGFDQAKKSGQDLAKTSDRESLRRHKKEIQAIRSNMQSYAQRIINQWQVPDSSFVEGNTSRQMDERSAVANKSARPSDQSVATTNAVIKAGDIHFAVLDTEINSDEKGPVLAHVVHGFLKGAKIIGNITQPENGQRIILKFNRMSIPGARQTIGINAVAIDMETARTALSSDTDNHYFSRYGSLLASAFLEGFGGSFAAQGTQIQINGTTVTSDQFKKSIGENAISALSKVGQKWGDAVAKNVNRPPTVKVYSGVGLGLLFMEDVGHDALLRQGLNTERSKHGR